MAEVNTTKVEVNEVVNPMNDVTEVIETNPSGGKKLVGFVIAGVAAVAVGAAVLFRKRKKMQQENLEMLEEDMDFDYEDLDEVDDSLEESAEVVAEAEENSKK